MNLIFVLFLNLFTAQANFSGQAKNIPWGGWWWPMISAETSLGWEDGDGRKTWKASEVKKFNKCLSLESSVECEKLLKPIIKSKGKSLSPLMKFDLYVANKLAETDTEISSDDFTQSATHELKIHHINSENHPHYPFKDFAGKCIGWSLSSIEQKEPTQTKEIHGVIFKPADIKAILAVAYTASIMFVPNKNFIGSTFLSGGSQSDFDNVLPHDLIKTLDQVIGKNKKAIVADLKANEEVWNYPIYGYETKYLKQSGDKVKGTIRIDFISDDVEIDEVFTTQPLSKRKDLVSSELEFELSVPSNWNYDIGQVKKSKWLGDAIEDHPDTLITGLEKDWINTVYEDYSDDEDMALEVNMELFKRSFEDETNYLGDLLKEYY